MSRNEGEVEGGLFVWRVFLYLKANLVQRVTVVRLDMSGCEVWMKGNTLQNDGTRIVECKTGFFKRINEFCEFG